MTETLFQKLEEKMMLILSEVEMLRNELQRVNQENATLKLEKDNHSQKLQSLISLLDTMNLVENAMPAVSVQIGKPILVQG